jgi:hypothetical protein
MDAPSLSIASVTKSDLAAELEPGSFRPTPGLDCPVE